MQFFRKHLNSRFTKFIILIVVVTFIGWGFSDILRQREPEWLIKVGEISYDHKDWQEAYKMMTNDPISAKEAVENPIPIRRRVADEMIKNALILQEAEQMGFVVSDEMVKSEVVRMKIFTNKDGKFDKNILENALKNNSLTEDMFVKKMQQQILRNQFLDFFYNTSGIMSQSLNDLLSKLISAEQKINLYKVDLIKNENSYTEDNLRNYMQENKHLFMTDEERKFSIAVFSRDFIKNKLSVTDKEIEEEYNREDGILMEPEKRLVHQIIISSYQDGQKLLNDIKNGKVKYEDALKIHAKNQLIPYEIGPFAIEGFDESIGTEIFKLKEGEVSELIQTPVGWHIFSVKKIIPAKKKDLSEVRDIIREKLLALKTANEMNTIIIDITDDLEHGKTLEEVATQYNVSVQHITERGHRDREGKIDIDKKSMKYKFGTISPSKVLMRVFETSEKFDEGIGSKVRLVSADDKASFALFQIDNVKEGEVMKFEDVKKGIESKYKEYLWGENTKTTAYELRNAMMENMDADKIESNTVKSLLKTIKPISEKFNIMRDNNKIPDCIMKSITNMTHLGDFKGFTPVCTSDDKMYYFAELKGMDFSCFDKLSEEERAMLKQRAYSIYHDILFNELAVHLKRKYLVKMNSKFDRYIKGDFTP